MNKLIMTIPLAAALWLAGCGESETPTIGTASATAPQRNHDVVRLGHGKALFQQHCAQCHGAGAQGAFNWRTTAPDGKYPPPPLNGSGHAWHHPRTALKQTIRQGTIGIGGSMPPWDEKLSEEDIDTIILWFQSLWSDEVYSAWLEIDRRAQQARR